MKKYTIERHDRRLVCLFINKTELRRSFGRETEILSEEPLPETIRQSPELKLYRITHWNNDTELDDFISAVQLYGYPVVVKVEGWNEWRLGFLIRDDRMKDLESSLEYSSVSYKECPDKQRDSYSIWWSGNTWYPEDKWNTYHENGEAISENTKVTLTIGQLKRLVRESINGGNFEYIVTFQNKHFPSTSCRLLHSDVEVSEKEAERFYANFCKENDCEFYTLEEVGVDCQPGHLYRELKKFGREDNFDADGDF